MVNGLAMTSLWKSFLNIRLVSRGKIFTKRSACWLLLSIQTLSSFTEHLPTTARPKNLSLFSNFLQKAICTTLLSNASKQIQTVLNIIDWSQWSSTLQKDSLIFINWESFIEISVNLLLLLIWFFFWWWGWFFLGGGVLFFFFEKKNWFVVCNIVNYFCFVFLFCFLIFKKNI